MAAYGRYKNTGDAAELDSAIDLLDRAVKSQPRRWPRFSYLNNLANALIDRVELRRQAGQCKRSMGDPEMRAATVHLGMVIAVKDSLDKVSTAMAPVDKVTAVMSDPGKVIAATGNHDMAVAAEPDLERKIVELAIRAHLNMKFDTNADVDYADMVVAVKADLDKALTCARWAAWARQGDSPDAARGLMTLARVLSTWERWGAKSPARPTLDESGLRIARMASAPIADRLRVLHQVSCSESEFRDALVSLARLVPRAVAWMGPEGQMKPSPDGTAGLVDDLVSLVLYNRNYTLAVELLEASRGILWDRLVDHSAPTVVRARAPRVAWRLDQAARRLEDHGGMPGDRRLARPRRSRIHERVADALLRRRRVREQRIWDRLEPRAGKVLLDEYRQGNSDRPQATFSLPDYTQDILPAAKEGPVIIAARGAGRYNNGNIYALVIQGDQDEPRYFELPSLRKFEESLRRYLLALDDTDAADRERVIRETLEWLHGSFGRMRHFIFGESDSAEESAVPKRVWWCPVGQLAILPLHAATSFKALPQGSERAKIVRGETPRLASPAFLQGKVGRVVERGEQVVPASSLLQGLASSYTPTLRVLHWARQMRDAQSGARADDTASRGRFLFVAAGSTSKFESLPGSGNVRESLKSLVPSDRLTEILGKGATTAAVLRVLGLHRWAHFDCHSIKHPRNPWHNGLALHDKYLTVEDLAKMRGDRPEFTFLAACVTALTDEDLPDEMITLAAAMQYTGCRYVIGTLTAPTDRSTARVTEEVYGAMFTQEGIPDPSESAFVLHKAVCAERARRGCIFLRGVPFPDVPVMQRS